MKIPVNLFLLRTVSVYANAQTWLSYVEDMANTVMAIWKDSFSSGNRKPALIPRCDFAGHTGLLEGAGAGKCLNYIQKIIDYLVDEKGNIPTYKYENLSLDDIAQQETSNYKR